MSRSDRRGVIFQPPQSHPSLSPKLATSPPKWGDQGSGGSASKSCSTGANLSLQGEDARLRAGGGLFGSLARFPLCRRSWRHRPQVRKITSSAAPLRPRLHSRPPALDGFAPHHGHGWRLHPARRRRVRRQSNRRAVLMQRHRGRCGR
jgi:hypothetical protein